MMRLTTISMVAVGKVVSRSNFQPRGVTDADVDAVTSSCRLLSIIWLSSSTDTYAQKVKKVINSNPVTTKLVNTSFRMAIVCLGYC